MLIKRPDYSKTILIIMNPLSTIGFRSSILASSADPDAAFDQRLHCLLRQKRLSVKEYFFFSKI